MNRVVAPFPIPIEPLRVGLTVVDASVGDRVEALLRPWQALICVYPNPGHVALDLMALAVDDVTDIDTTLHQSLSELKIPWVVCGANEEAAEAFGAIARGAKGYLCASTASELVAGFELVASGGVVVGFGVGAQIVQERTGAAPLEVRFDLPARQAEILDLLLSGLDNREIAARTYLGTETVKSHLRALYRNLGARSRTEAIAIATGRK